MKIKLLFCICCFTTILQAQNTLIPDSNFEQRLIDMGYDSGMIDGVVSTANINTITTLFLPNSSISDFTGIEDFTALESFDTIGNPITSLDLSSNTALKSFYTGQNQLTSLNISNNFLLETLVCSGTLLGSLDVSNNINLQLFICNNSQLTSLDVSNNTALTNLVAGDNLFTELDLSNNSALQSFNCLAQLHQDNLTNVNLKNGNNVALVNVNLRFNNNLTCVEVDDEVAANAGTGSYASWQADAGVTYSASCASCPEMEIQGNNITITDEDTMPDISDGTDFGIVSFGSFTEMTYTVLNIGDSALNLTGSPLISIANSTDFTVTQQPATTISENNGSTVFTLRYTPSMAGTVNTATISIESNDCTETIYNFDVKGESQAPLSIVENTLRNGLLIYPNPNNGSFNVTYLGNQTLERAIVYDISGRKIKTISLADYENNKSLHLGLRSGIYFLKIQSEKESVLKRIIIK